MSNIVKPTSDTRLVELGGVLAEQGRGLRPGSEVDHRSDAFEALVDLGTDAGPFPSQLEVHVVEDRAIGFEGVGRQAVERLLERRLCYRLGIARHGGTDDRGGQGADENDSWDQHSVPT